MLTAGDALLWHHLQATSTSHTTRATLTVTLVSMSGRLAPVLRTNFYLLTPAHAVDQPRLTAWLLVPLHIAGQLFEEAGLVPHMKTVASSTKALSFKKPLEDLTMQPAAPTVPATAVLNGCAEWSFRTACASACYYETAGSASIP